MSVDRLHFIPEQDLRLTKTMIRHARSAGSKKTKATLQLKIVRGDVLIWLINAALDLGVRTGGTVLNLSFRYGCTRAYECAAVIPLFLQRKKESRLYKLYLSYSSIIFSIVFIRNAHTPAGFSVTTLYDDGRKQSNWWGRKSYRTVASSIAMLTVPTTQRTYVSVEILSHSRLFTEYRTRPTYIDCYASTRHSPI